MVFGIALGTTAGLAGAVFYVAHHIAIQTTLFLVAGLVERQGGSTSVDRLGGLARTSPLLAVLFFVPAMNLAGIPPLSGFIGKLGLLQAGVAEGSAPALVLVGGGVVTSLLTLVAIARVWTRAFWRPPAQEPAADTARAAAADAGPDTGSAPSPAPVPDGRQAGDGAADREPVGVAAPAGGPAAGTAADGPGRAAAGGRRAAARQRAWARHRAVATATAPAEDGLGDGSRGRRPSPARPLPRVMLGATVAMVAVTASLTLLAGGLYGYTDRAAGDLRERTPYLESVLGEETQR
jgi:multicomponent Na+:H+ antiporter subunit D